MSLLPWFRLYSEMPHDERIEEIAFEDRWHYVNILCMKCAGILDKSYQTEKMRDRKIARELGLDSEAADFVRIRLHEIGLVDEDWQPSGWSKRQYKSDSSAERVRKYRENKKKEECNGGVTLQKRNSNAIDTDTDTDTEKKKKETKKKKFTPSFSPPPHIDSALWDEFIKHRKAMKSPMTDMAKKMLVGRLETLRAGGHNPDDLLKTAIMNGWKSVYPEKPETKPIGSIRNERLAREFQNQNTEGPGHDRGTVSALLCREKAGRG